MVLLGALGGYLTPSIAGSSEPNHVALFTYLAFLNVALVGSAVIRGWRFLKPIALLATMIVFGLWLAFGFDPEVHTWSTQWLLTLLWFIFLLGVTLPPVIWQRGSNWLDLGTLSTNSLWFVGVTWGLFHDRPDQQMALVCWGMTLLHLALFGLTYNRVSNTDRMPRVHLALAAIFFILAMPLQLEDSLSYLGLAWAAQGVVLSAVGIYFRDKQMCVSSLIVFGLAAMRLLLFDYFDRPEPLGAIDQRFLMFEMSALLMLLGGALYPLAGRLLRKGTGERPLLGTGRRRAAGRGQSAGHDWVDLPMGQPPGVAVVDARCGRHLDRRLRHAALRVERTRRADLRHVAGRALRRRTGPLPQRRS